MQENVGLIFRSLRSWGLWKQCVCVRKRWFCPPLLKPRWFWLAMAKKYCPPAKRRGFAPQTPETDEKNAENGGCHSGRTTVCQKHRFCHPEKRAWYLPKRRVGIARRLLWSASQVVQEDRTMQPHITPKEWPLDPNLLPAVLLFSRIDFLKFTVTITVLNFREIDLVSVTVASPSWPPQPFPLCFWFAIAVLKFVWISFPEFPLPLPPWFLLNWKRNNFECDAIKALQGTFESKARLGKKIPFVSKWFPTDSNDFGIN